MSAAARSVAAFGYYLLAVAAGLMFSPDAVLAPLGFARIVDVWVRVVGLLALVLGTYYIVAARNELVPLMRASVAMRASVIFVLGMFVVTGLAPRALLTFGIVDLAAALWTARALAAPREART